MYALGSLLPNIAAFCLIFKHVCSISKVSDSQSHLVTPQANRRSHLEAPVAVAVAVSAAAVAVAVVVV